MQRLRKQVCLDLGMQKQHHYPFVQLRISHTPISMTERESK